jgi:hypothetical protein
MDRQLRQALYSFLAAALFLSPAVIAADSGWSEEPTVFKGSAPQAAPDYRIRRKAPPPVQDLNEAESRDRTAFYVTPKVGTKAPLEAGVSRWGIGTTKSGPSNSLRGGASDTVLRVPLQGKPDTATVDPSVFRGFLEKNHPQFALKTSQMSPNSLLEVRGKWDDSGHTLRSLGIRFTSIRSGRMRDQPLDQVKVLVVNCDGNVPREARQRIRDWVAQGGYLLTTDWALSHLTQVAFPGIIEWNNEKTDTDMVSATVVYPDPITMKGTVSNAYWKLDEQSEMVRVLRPNLCKILVRSRDLVAEDPDRMGILAVEFPFGKGRVLHLVGHFDNNAGLAFNNKLADPAPVIGISLRQALATNFIVAGLEHDAR